MDTNTLLIIVVVIFLLGGSASTGVGVGTDLRRTNGRRSD